MLAWLADADAGGDDLLGQGRGGPANPRSAGFDRATLSWDDAIDRAFQDARLPRQEVAAACFALAGTDRDSDRRTVQRWAAGRKVARCLKLVNDAEPILIDGTPAGWGIALIAGTGSFAFGRNDQGQSERVGGWGYIFGDEGSGYALSVAGLRAAAQAADGRGAQTRLLARFQDALSVTSPMRLIEAIYRHDVDRRAIAQLATVVVDAALDGDTVANELLEVAAGELANMVSALCRRLEMSTSSLPLALAGSLLLRGASLQARLLTRLAETHAITPTLGEVHQPVRGALTIARGLL